MFEKLCTLPGLDPRRAASLLLIICAGTSVSASADASADEEYGAHLAFKYHCTTCHGQNGVASSDRYPNLAGQPVAYLVSRLKYFRDGGERGNQMNGQAAPLSDEEIDKLAAFFNNPT